VLDFDPHAQDDQVLWALVARHDFWGPEVTAALEDLDRRRRRAAWVAVGGLTGLAAALSIILIAAWLAVVIEPQAQARQQHAQPQHAKHTQQAAHPPQRHQKPAK
jgi:hypothetical protein